MKSLDEARVAIVGLGLMGGSMAGALQGKCRAVHGIARRQETIVLARERGFIDQGSLDLADGLRDADIVILSTPVRTIIRLLKEIGPFLTPGCLVMDLGSTKAEITAQMDQLPQTVHPVGGHPMCGKEVAGLEAAEARLFVGRPFVICPLPRTGSDSLTLAHDVVEAVGARPIEIDPERHDRLVAQVSHLPYLIASALVTHTDAVASVDPLVWQLASSGFRDTSRLAACDVTMMLDILVTNRRAVASALEAYGEQLRSAAQLIASEDEAGLQRLLDGVSQRRKDLFE
ncbi:MAG: prephenate dehydrogenase [Chloroflexi bacterium]|nr:prephenate dehydrogenase [Chloroflexota bacterium]